MTIQSETATPTRLTKLKAMEARGEITLDIIDINGIKNRRDAHAAIKAVLKATIDDHFSVADRNYYLIQIDLKRRDIELEARLKAIEERLAALESAGRPKN
jgi:hypothetical protein